MKVFLFNSKTFFEINKKEEMTDDTFIISDKEEYEIEQSLEQGEVWVDDTHNLRWSGVKAGDFYKWDSKRKKWIFDQIEADAALQARRDSVWNNVKEYREKKNNGGVLEPISDKWFDTDQTSQTAYDLYGKALAKGQVEPQEWKTMDNTTVTLTQEILDSLQGAIYGVIKKNFDMAEKLREQIYQSQEPETISIENADWGKCYLSARG
ncbi:hypothetical protein A4G18_00375 [Pasteurellaceae bacterium Pebbles2]|nr:hypothetical protein [Pasteurellaceae bacterium Pebbles2]